MKQNKRGISLIVLVITIIVIIILAAAVILTINNNNPMDNANKARYTSDRANVQDALSTAVGKIAADKLCSITIPAQVNISNGIVYDLTGASDGVTHGIIGWDTLATGDPTDYEKTTMLGMKMPDYGSNTRWFINDNGEVSVEVSGVIYGPGGTVIKSLKPGDVASEDTAYTVNGKTAVIPKGFYISTETTEQSIDNGLVVVAPDSTADSKGSEFVWVPVDNIFTMFQIQSGNIVGKLTSYSENGDKDGTKLEYSTSGHREPDTLTNYDNNIAELEMISTILNEPLETEDDFQKMMQKEINAIHASILKNKGFYIGRYETGDLNKVKVVSKRGNTDISSTDENKITWYTMYAKEKNYATKLGMDIKSSMIYGSQWDAVMRWFAADLNTAGYITDAHDKGNWTSTVKPTGQYAVKNIYDMAGNVLDWSAEANSTKNRILRGGDYSYVNNQYAGYRGSNNPIDSTKYYGTRLALYL